MKFYLKIACKFPLQFQTQIFSINEKNIFKRNLGAYLASKLIKENLLQCWNTLCSKLAAVSLNSPLLRSSLLDPTLFEIFTKITTLCKHTLFFKFFIETQIYYLTKHKHFQMQTIIARNEDDHNRTSSDADCI